MSSIGVSKRRIGLLFSGAAFLIGAWSTHVFAAPPSAFTAPADTLLEVGVGDGGEYGHRFGTNQNRVDVIAAFDGTGTDLQLDVTGFDIDAADEVAVLLNQAPIGFLSKGADNGLNGGDTFVIPAGMQLAGENRITFRQVMRPGFKWGVTGLLLEDYSGQGGSADISLTVGTSDTGEYGHRFGTNQHRAELVAAFTGAGSDLELDVTGFDIDSKDEVAVFINGNLLGYLGTGPDKGLNTGDTFVIPAGMQVAGENRIVFRQVFRVGFQWGVTQILLANYGGPSGGVHVDLTLGVEDPGAYGKSFGSNSNRAAVVVAFDNAGEDLQLRLSGFDIDFRDEVAVYLNDWLIGYLTKGKDKGLNLGDIFVIPAGLQVAGENRVVFRQNLQLGFQWGVTDLFIDTLLPNAALPPVLSGLVTQLESSQGVETSASRVESWADFSASGNDLFASGNPQLVAGATPSGLPAINLDGVGDQLDRIVATHPITGLPQGNADRTMFVVARFLGASGWGGVTYGTAANNEAFGLVVRPQGGQEFALQGFGVGNDLLSGTRGIGAGWVVMSLLLADGTATLYRGGNEIASWDHDYGTNVTRFVIGQEIANNGFVDMDIAAVLAYDRALGNGQRGKVEDYLARKYLLEIQAPVAISPQDCLDADPQALPEDCVIDLLEAHRTGGTYPWFRTTGFNDPTEVFRMQQNDVLRVKGTDIGALLTQESYKNYHMIMEFRWGDMTFGPRTGLAKDAGLLVHGRGQEGSFANKWMPHIQVQVLEGGMGDLILLPGTDRVGNPLPLSMTSTIEQLTCVNNTWNCRGGYVWDPAGTEMDFDERLDSVHRLDWDPGWEDVEGFRGVPDLENADGEWNQVVVIADGDTLEIYFNGVKVNEATNVVPSEGKIQLLVEWAEYFVRRWELWPVGTAPAPSNPLPN